MLGTIKGKSWKAWQRMKWLDSITNSVDMDLSKLWEIVKARGAWRAAVHGVTKSWTCPSDWNTTIAGTQLHPNSGTLVLCMVESQTPQSCWSQDGKYHPDDRGGLTAAPTTMAVSTALSSFCAHSHHILGQNHLGLDCAEGGLTHVQKSSFCDIGGNRRDSQVFNTLVMFAKFFLASLWGGIE